MAQNILDDNLQAYCDSMTSKEPEYLQGLGHETLTSTGAPNMLSGFFQGRLLSFLSKIVKPRHILEIGTFTGYSALCLAEGLLPEGKVTTIDPDQQWYEMYEKYASLSDLSDKIEWIEGRAEEAINNIEGPFDLVFIDAAKKSYKLYFDLLIPKLSSGSLVIADNVLWKGKVIQKEKDEKTAALHAFNMYVSSLEEFETILLPIRDGLLCCRKK